MKTMKKAFASMALLSIALLASCGGETSSAGRTSSAGGTSSGTSTSVDTSSSADDGEELVVRYKGESLYENGTAAKITVGDNAAMLVAETAGTAFESSDAGVLAVSSNGKLTAKKAGTATITATAGTAKLTINFTVTDSTVAAQGHSYTAVDYEEKGRALAALEKYAVDNYLTGITIFSNGSKVAYNGRYTPEPKSYINGYGWGTMREGKLDSALTKALSGKTTYYNIGTTSLPAHANAMNASGSDVSTVYDYIANAYYATRMNQTSDGYEWYPSLAKDEKPIPVEEPTELNADGSVKTPGAAISSTDARYNNNRRWRIHVRTGSQAEGGLVYRTGSKNSFTSAYDKKEVKLEDYITPLKFMLTAWNGQYRGAELTTGVSGFTGSATYFNFTSNDPEDGTIWDEKAWNKYMGANIYTGTDADGDFIEFNLLEDCTQFYAMYYLSSSLYSPLPADFISHWGGNYLGKNNSEQGVTTLDTMLATGPYYIEEWDNTKVINFKKNDEYFWKQDSWEVLGTTITRDVYNIDGISYNYIGDASQLKQHFLAGETDSYGPKPEDLKTGGDFATSSGEKDGVKWRLYETKGDSNFKLNVNAQSEKDWIKRFGKQGTNAQVGYSTKTWTKLNKNLDNKTPETAIKPYMNNIHFLNFLSFAINRQEICEARGSVPTQEYLSDNYLIDPEQGVSYNSTDAHKAVLADRYNDTYGFSETYAKAELEKAFEEVIFPLGSNGAFNSKSGSAGAGSASNPWIVPIDMEWMNTNDKSDYSDVFTYVKKIFKEVSDESYGGNYELAINETNGNSDYQQVYNLMKQGQFDLGFGSISGNALNPLNFLEVLKSDNSSTFTLNWGPDTDVVGAGLYSGADAYKNKIIYDGKQWSFDGLWAAADKGAILDGSGNVAEAQNVSTGGFTGGKKYQSVNTTNSTITYKISFKQLIEAGAASIKLKLSNASADTGWETFTVNYDEDGATKLTTDSNGVVELTVGSQYNYADGSTNAAENVTVTITYSGTLQNHTANGITQLTKNFTDTMNLLTYTGYTAAQK